MGGVFRTCQEDGCHDLVPSDRGDRLVVVWTAGPAILTSVPVLPKEGVGGLSMDIPEGASGTGCIASVGIVGILTLTLACISSGRRGARTARHWVPP